MRLLFNTGRAFEHFARRVVLWLHCIAFPSAHKKKKKKKKTETGEAGEAGNAHGIKFELSSQEAPITNPENS